MDSNEQSDVGQNQADGRGDNRSRLDATLLLNNQTKSVGLSKINLEVINQAEQSNKMVKVSLRRRNTPNEGNLNQGNEDRSSHVLANDTRTEEKAIYLPQKPVYLTQELSLTKKTTEYNKRKSSDDHDNLASGRDSTQDQKAQCKSAKTSLSPIFSISASSTTTTILVVASMMLVASIGLVSLNFKGSAMLVSAQYPAGKSTSASSSSGGTAKPARPTATTAPQQHKFKASDRMSIDRFDSGEQIRAPLLSAPTTLAPKLAARQQQFSVDVSDKFNGLDTAATQADSYMSPEERDQLMKSQESHYEGKQSQDGPQSGPEGDRGAEGAPLPVRDVSQQPQMTASNNNNMSPGLQQEASANNADNDEDPDYEEGEGANGLNEQLRPLPQTQQAPTRANSLVPENRRMGAAGNNRMRHQSQAPIVPEISNADESGDSGNDDYGPAANDDAYFSRKSTGGGGGPSNLNLAASYNHQNNRQHEGQSQRGLANMLYDSPSRYSNNNNNPDGNEEAQGFGPGPNEAYLAERAENSGQGIADGGDDDSSGADSDSDAAPTSAASSAAAAAAAANANEENSNPIGDAHLVDRRMSARANDQQQAYANSMAASYGNNNGNARGQSGNMDALEAPGRDSAGPDDASGGGDPDSADSYTSSSQSNPSKSHVMTPKSSASAPAPSSAPNPSQFQINRQRQMVRNNEVNLGPSSSSSPWPPSEALKLKQQAADQWQQERIRHNPHLLQAPIPATLGDSRSTKSAAGLARQQPPARLPTQAPYNPQNNPSHAGKYFIN